MTTKLPMPEPAPAVPAPAGAPCAGRGLVNLRWRVKQLGGSIEFSRSESGGALVRFECPLR